MDKEEQRWVELTNIWKHLPSELKVKGRSVYYETYRNNGGKRVHAVEMALDSIHQLPPSTEFAPMDGGQEYEDTLAGQEIFEALKEG